MNIAGDKNIFVSYRRHDSTGDTFQLVKSLKQYFDEKRIFLDNEKLMPGEDFPKVLKQNLKQCDIVLVVIGKQWIDTDASGAALLMNEANWVRIEIATAIRHNKLIIPILIDGARMPGRTEVPDVLFPFLIKQAKEVYYRTWDNDIKDLANFLEQKGVPFIKNEKQEKNLVKTWALLLLIALSIGAYLVIKFIIEPANNFLLNKGKQIEQTILPGKKQAPPASRYDIAGTWRDEQNKGKIYYKILNTLTGYKLQVCENESLQMAGNISQKDSIVTMSYTGNKTGKINLNTILSADGKKMKGKRTIGVSVNNIAIAIPITLIKAD